MIPRLLLPLSLATCCLWAVAPGDAFLHPGDKSFARARRRRPHSVGEFHGAEATTRNSPPSTSEVSSLPPRPFPATSTSQGDGSITSSITSLRAVNFVSPLLEAGYPPAVLEAERYRTTDASNPKPLLLYLPGFDGTLVAPFLQYPELGTIFEVRGMEVPMDDRSTFRQLADVVLEHLRSAALEEGRLVYVMGESFGGLLALEVAMEILQSSRREESKEANSSSSGIGGIHLGGLVLVNPATSYLRSNLAIRGPEIASLPAWQYPFGVLSLLPLFVDDYGLPQLLMMLSSEALPSVIDTAQREAYMGRTAFSLPNKLKFMPRDTLRWRLEEWLSVGNRRIDDRLAELEERDDGKGGQQLPPVLILAGGDDRTLPAADEAQRLRNILTNCEVHVVEGAGHAGTCGSRVDLAALMRGRFPELLKAASGSELRLGQGDGDNLTAAAAVKEADAEEEVDSGRTAMKDVAASGEGKYFGMEPRYDGRVGVGLSPLEYWTEELYREWKG